MSSTVDSVQGTSNQVLANGTAGTPQVGAVTLTLPQSIDTGASVQGGFDLATIRARNKVADVADKVKPGESRDELTVPFRRSLRGNPTAARVCRDMMSEHFNPTAHHWTGRERPVQCG